MFKSLRWRITIPYVSLTLLIMLGLGVYLSWFIRNNYLSNLENSLTAQAYLMGDAVKPLLSDPIGNQNVIDDLAKSWSKILEERVTFINFDGTVLGESHQDSEEMDNHLNRPEVQKALSVGQGSSIRHSATVGYEMMYVAVRITDHGNPTGFSRVALSIEDIDANVRQLRQQIFLTTLIAAGLTIALSMVIAKRIAQPLEDLTQSAISMAHTENLPLSPSAAYNEVGKLSEALHSLVFQLRTQIQALKTEQTKLSSVLEQMTDGVIIINDNGVIEMINPMAEFLFKIDPGAAPGQTLIQVLRHHQIIDLWESCKESGQEKSGTFDLVRQRKYIQVIVISLAPNLPGKFLILFQDLTRRRRLEAVRRDFISNISHELRTPLASLKALTETLQDGAIEDPPAANRFLSHMEMEVDALSHMVSELLELTRIESGQVPLELQPVSPMSLILNANDRMNVQAERAKVTLLHDYPDNLPNVLADPPRLGQAIVNLLHNAIKFTPEGGKIILKAKSQEDVVVFSVEDTGVGIPADDLPRIFERFYKADRARSGGGTGLGLAITRHLVEAHGGIIWVDSIEGRGSVFTFTIPKSK